MAEESLQIRLEITDQHLCQYMLSFDSWQYPIMLKPGASIIFREWLRRLSPVLVGYKDPAEEHDPQDLLRNVGTWLWRALLPEHALAQGREALAQALRTGRSPLLLAFPDVLTGLPWELLYDPDQSGEQGFLARCRPLVRLSPTAATAPPIELPLRVLLLISSPPSLGEDSRIDVESERAAVEHAVHNMRQAGLLHLFVEDIVTPKRAQQVLMRFKPHIVHYIGHGGYSETNGGVLLWEDEQGNVLELSTERLASLLNFRNLQAVVLHACRTGWGNARMDVPSIADILVKEGIPVVLAQQANFTYESSQRASEAWYTALTVGETIASALFEVRQALTQADRPDWAVPILQGGVASLEPAIDVTSLPGPADPLLSRMGAAANLPAPIGIFVGRHRELRTLRLMLESVPGSGPVMALITGPGGVGKSTLAAQAVTRYGNTYKAVLTLRCQGYQGIDLFLQRIGEFLKRQDSPGFLERILPDLKLSTEAKIEEAVIALDAAGSVLLVIDNLEDVQNDDHTINDEALLYLLQTLLTNLRGGRTLIIGRYAVKDLLPQGKFAANLLRLDLIDLSIYETNQLLMRHSALAQLGETVHKKLIEEFGGLPYVYDLLSSKAASQSLDLLIHDVQGRITEARKQHMAKEWQEVRQQVIEFAALEATVNSLSPASQALLAQLSVLHRPFPLASIEEGLGAVRTAWQPLLDWSLLHYDSQEKNYYLHSLTRHYAEGLLEDPLRRQAQVQLATWYENYAHQESHDLVDYLEAHRLLRAAGRMQQAGQLVMGLAEVLARFGLYSLLGGLYAITLNDIESNEQLAADALHGLGNLASVQGKYEEARGFYLQSLNILECWGNQRGRANSLHELGTLAYLQGEYEEARSLYQQSLEIAEQLGDQNGRATALHQLGTLAYLLGRYEEARGFYQKSLNIFELRGDQSGRARSLNALGLIVQEQGRYEEAYNLYQQSLDILERLGDQDGQAAVLHTLGALAKDLGEYEEAYNLYQQSLAIRVRIGDRNGYAHSLHQLGMMFQDLGRYEEARGFYQQSLAIKEQIEDQRGRASSLHHLGMIAQNQGEYEEARKFHQQSLAITKLLGDMNGHAGTLHELGNLAYIQDKYEEAYDLYQQSLDIFERKGDRRGQATSLGQLGLLAFEQGNFENALMYMIQAYILFDTLQSPNLAFIQSMIIKIREHMDEKTFMTHWQTFAGDRPPIAKADEVDRDDVLTIERLLSSVSSAILHGTTEQRQQFAANLVEAQQQLSPEETPLGGFLGCLVAVLREETPEVALLEPPFMELWQALQDTLNAPPNKTNQGEMSK